jgi:hypothetical protein
MDRMALLPKPVLASVAMATVAVAAVTVAGCSSSGNDPSGLSIGGSGPRPADACTMLTSDQLATIVGTPGPFTGVPEDPANDGTPVWGCTWGTQKSYVDIRELTAGQFNDTNTPDPDIVDTPLSGIGDQAKLQKNRSDGTNSYVYFRTAGRYYEVQVGVDRYAYEDAPNAGHEASAAQFLAKISAPRLSR